MGIQFPILLTPYDHGKAEVKLLLQKFLRL